MGNKPVIAHDAGITVGFDENVFKTKVKVEPDLVYARYFTAIPNS